MLPAASLARLAVGSSIGLTLYVQFRVPDDGWKNRLKHVECPTKMNCETLHLLGCTLRIY